MNSTTSSPLAQRRQADPARTVGRGSRALREPRTRNDGAPTRWISLAHAALNQAKMASPRRASASSGSSVPSCR